MPKIVDAMVLLHDGGAADGEDMGDANAVDTKSIAKHERQVHRLKERLLPGYRVLESRPRPAP